MTTRGEFRELSVYTELDKSRWDEGAVNFWINEAILDYSAHFPRYVPDVSIDCVNDQREYPLAAYAGIQAVLRVEYPKGEDPPVVLMRRSEADPRGFYGGGFYDVRGHHPPTTLVIGEEPDAGEDIGLSYHANHATLSEDTGVLTVPDQHLDALRLYVHWRALRATLNRFETNPDMDEIKNLGQAAMVFIPGLRLTVENAKDAYDAKIAAYKETQASAGVVQWDLPDRWAQEEWA